MNPRTRATVEDLYRVQETGKAELVNGEIVLVAPTGGIPGRAGGEIYISLRDYERRTGRGYAFPDNVRFTVDLPHRGSFSPDAAFHAGPLGGERFLEVAPIFAVEVCSGNDYGERAEQEMAEIRTDYFAAGTLVVWDVDVLHERVVGVYRPDEPNRSTTYYGDDVAEAEPALPAWTMPVRDLLP
jgi:Uma2 family endonuclease